MNDAKELAGLPDGDTVNGNSLCPVLPKVHVNLMFYPILLDQSANMCFLLEKRDEIPVLRAPM